MDTDPYKEFGRPTWTSETVAEGLDISAKAKEILFQEHGYLYFWEYFRTLKEEPSLFLRLDIRDFREPRNATFLKAFLEKSSPYPWPKVQRKTAVLVCSIEECLEHRGWLANVVCSGVKWQERKAV